VLRNVKYYIFLLQITSFIMLMVMIQPNRSKICAFRGN